jgi:hypothetical protein
MRPAVKPRTGQAPNSLFSSPGPKSPLENPLCTTWTWRGRSFSGQQARVDQNGMIGCYLKRKGERVADFRHDQLVVRGALLLASSLRGALQMGVGIGRNLITIGGKSQNPPPIRLCPRWVMHKSPALRIVANPATVGRLG